MTFEELNLNEDILDALKDEGYEEPTPIQRQTIPPLLQGRDVLGVAQTGTGKTASFALPILQHLSNGEPPKGRGQATALVVTPTRELAAQIGESFDSYGRYIDTKHTVIFGGVKQGAQVSALRKGVDVLVATPGRLLDLMGQGHIDLTHVKYFVLDEADRMLDMGFINDIKRILKVLPEKRQNLLFSATMPSSIAELAGTFLHDPVMVSVTPEEPTVEAIEQKVMFVSKADKKRLLPWVIGELGIDRAIVFTRTKHGANRLVKELLNHNIGAAAIHGNKSQGARTRALDGFKEGEVDILVATDIASRGLDIEAVDYVFNYDLPNEQESYVHRIGRTGRAGRSGSAISFCEVEEGAYLRDIERLIGFEIAVDTEHPFHDASAIPSANATGGKKGRGGSRGGGGGGGGGRSSSPRSTGNQSSGDKPAGQYRRRRNRGGRRGGAAKSD